MTGQASFFALSGVTDEQAATIEELLAAIEAGGGTVPIGGTTGQVLAKINATNYNTEWITISTEGIDAPAVAGSALQFLQTIDGTNGNTQWATISGGGDALVANPLSQFAATTSLQLKGVLSDETGSGALVFATSPTLVTPVLGVASATSINGATITSGTLNGSVTGTNTGDETAGGILTKLLTVDGAGSGLDADLLDGNSSAFYATASSVSAITSGVSAAFDTLLEIETALGNKQPLDADLTTIAGLTATTDSFMQAKGSAWAARTIAQVKTDLGLTGTNSGDQTSIVGFSNTKAQFDTVLSDGNFSYVGNTLVADHGGGNWKVFYTNGSGVIVELALGASGEFLKSNGAASAPTFASPAGGGDALVANPLSQFAATTSLQLKGVISDETGSGELVFATSPTLVTPALGTPSALVLTNATGLPLAAVLDSTSEALGVGSLEIGHASDTTLTRVSAGLVAVEGVNLVRSTDIDNTKIATLTFIIDGGGSAITTGVKGYLEIPFACTINRATALADQSGSIVVDIWKDTYANYPPVDADSITASAPVTISATTKAQDATLTGWTTAVATGDILGFNVDSITTCQRVTVSLRVVKT